MDRLNNLQGGGDGELPSTSTGRTQVFVTPTTKARLEREFFGFGLTPTPRIDFSRHPPNKPFHFQAQGHASRRPEPVKKRASLKTLHKSQGRVVNRKQVQRKETTNTREQSRQHLLSQRRMGLTEQPVPTKSENLQAKQRAIGKALGTKNDELPRKDRLALWKQEKQQREEAAAKAKSRPLLVPNRRLGQKNENVQPSAKTSANVVFQGSKQPSEPAVAGPSSKLKAKPAQPGPSGSNSRPVTRAMSAANKASKAPSTATAAPKKPTAGSKAPAPTSTHGRAPATKSSRGAANGTTSGRGLAAGTSSATTDVPRGVRGRGGKVANLRVETANLESLSECPLPPIAEVSPVPPELKVQDQSSSATPTEPAATPTKPAATPTEPAATAIEAAATSTDPAATPTEPAKATVPEAKFKGFDPCYIMYNRKLLDAIIELEKTKLHWEGQIPGVELDHKERVGDILRVTGKIGLLYNSKLPQFVGLLSRYLQKNSLEMPVLESDLEGWWDYASVQIDEVLAESNKLHEWQARGWVEEIVVPAPTVAPIRPKPSKSSETVKPATASVHLKEFLAKIRRQKAKGEGAQGDGEVPASEATNANESVPEETQLSGKDNEQGSTVPSPVEEVPSYDGRTPSKSMPPPSSTPRSVRRVASETRGVSRRTSLVQMRISNKGRLSVSGNTRLAVDENGFNFNLDISLMNIGLGLDDSVSSESQ